MKRIITRLTIGVHVFISVGLCFIPSILYADTTIRWALKGLPHEATGGMSEEGTIFYEEFHDGMAVFKDYGTKLYGAIDTNGNIVIPPLYKELSDFYGGTAIVSTEEGEGIINKYGEYVIEPKKGVSIFLCRDDQYGYGEIIPTLLKYAERNVTRLLYHGKELTYNKYCDNIHANNKYVAYNNDNIRPIAFDLRTGEQYSYSAVQDEYSNTSLVFQQIKGYPDSAYLYDRTTGNRLSLSKVSSKGIQIVTDAYKEGCLKNENGESKTSSQNLTYPIPYWQYDCVGAKTKDKKGKYVCYFFNSDGDIIVEYIASLNPTFEITQDYILIHEAEHEKKQQKTVIYNHHGNELFTLKYNNFSLSYIIGDYWSYSKGGKEYLVNTKRNMVYSDVNVHGYKGGMILANMKKKNTYMWIDLENDSCHIITSSGAKLQEGGFIMCGSIFFNKQGDIVRKSDSIIYFDSDISDGVIAVCYRSNGKFENGYIYIPQDSSFQYVYGTEEMNTERNKKILSDCRWEKYRNDRLEQQRIRQERINRLFADGLQYFDNGKYAKSKDCFYKIIVDEEDSNNANAYYNYALCLERLGYYDNAINAYRKAMEIDPTMDPNQECITNCERSKAEAIARYQRTQAILEGISETLNSIGTTITESVSATNQTSGSSYSYSSSSSNNYTTSSNNNTSNTKSDAVKEKEKELNESSYKNRDSQVYADLENQLSKMNTYYNTYNSNQRIQIQTQMRNIRKKWEARGYNMRKSDWEDWDGIKK